MRHCRNRLLAIVRDFLRKEDGPTAVEYAVMLGMIIIVCFVAIQTIGTASRQNFNAPALSNALSGGS